MQLHTNGRNVAKMINPTVGIKAIIKVCLKISFIRFFFIL